MAINWDKIPEAVKIAIGILHARFPDLENEKILKIYFDNIDLEDKNI